ncbi:hypothetical protein AB0J86_21585 [Micromonospora sp. NPDC049559]|uniref:hypothetical protein n=1 Tax=Micromonospora sp. NPDC049559 TaxID=3155923 RepID=UPI00343678DE
MVAVRLAQNWTDSSGRQHSAGELVYVPGGLVPKLERAGVIGSPVGPGRGRYLGLPWTGARDAV